MGVQTVRLLVGTRDRGGENPLVLPGARLSSHGPQGDRDAGCRRFPRESLAIEAMGGVEGGVRTGAFAGPRVEQSNAVDGGARKCLTTGR
jgi:hypothetical protein